MCGIFIKKYYENPEWKAGLKAAIVASTVSLNKTIAAECSFIEPKLSALYNAYTEKAYVEQIKYLDNLGAHSLYADSGGLQMVTAGKSITPALKDEIYKIQCQADLAMCFDVIPLEKVTLHSSKNERVNTGNKVFNSFKHRESGELTGKNIVRQIEVFRKNSANTKVIVIVQGNNSDDMLLYFNEIQKQIPEELLSYIGGIAVADTCMGNGEAESVEMLKAAHLIAKECAPEYSKHLHLLGVGAIPRMKPAIYLKKNGFLETYDNISYDSSSHTNTYIFGQLKLNGQGAIYLGRVRTKQVEEYFANIYTKFEDVLAPLVTLDEFYSVIFNPKNGHWEPTDLRARLWKETETRKVIAGGIAGLLHTYYQIDSFSTTLDRVWKKSALDKSPIGMLNSVKSVTDLDRWMKDFSPYIESNRIHRKEEIRTLESLF